MNRLIFLSAILIFPSLVLAQSEASLPYVGWELDAPYADPTKGNQQSIRPDSKMGRQIAASASYHNEDHCRQWYGQINGFARSYVAKARASNPREFAAFRASIAKAVKRLSIDKTEDACIILTSPYQAGGDAADLMPWDREGFYPEHEE